MLQVRPTKYCHISFSFTHLWQLVTLGTNIYEHFPTTLYSITNAVSRALNRVSMDRVSDGYEKFGKASVNIAQRLSCLSISEH